MRARLFTLENELDRLKVEVSEKDQLSEQVSFDYKFCFIANFLCCKNFKKALHENEEFDHHLNMSLIMKYCILLISNNTF